MSSGESSGGRGPRSQVSVCLATYNGEQYLEEQLQSILPQLLPGDEVIVVDDKSTDGTATILERWQQQFQSEGIASHLEINNFNVGHRETFRRSILLSTRPFVMLSDQDDLWADGRVELMLSEISKSGAGLLFGSLECFGTVNDRIVNPDWTRSGYRELLLYLLRHRWSTFFYGSACCFRRELVDSSLSVANKTHEQWLYAQVLGAGGRVRSSSSFVTYRRMHEENASRTRSWSSALAELPWEYARLLRTYERRRRAGL